MNYKWLGIGAAIVALVAWIAYDANQANQLTQETQVLQRGGTVASPTPDPAPMPPTRDLVVAKIPTDNIWFVGKYEDGGGVEIPFRPGESPRITNDLTPRHANPGFVGPDQCKECHPENYHSFLATSHYNTSRWVDENSIDGNFEMGANTFRSSDPNVHFEMIRRGDRFLQRTHFFDWSFEVPMELIIGSSKMAQTYLYWHDDGLYQHNITHITDGDRWINSPGYIDGDAAYARPVPQRCLDCHMTYFDFRGPPNRYTPNSLVLGVTCERCHGPAAEHVAFHREHPSVEEANSIVNPKKLERQTQMEICGQCHAGSRHLKDRALSFRPGSRLDDHYLPANDEEDAKNSVHTSNQLLRLSQSRCFEQSEMTCIDCHDPHHNERGEANVFSQRCMKCHENESDCGFFPREGIDFADDCISCHMPSRPTKELKLRSVEGDVFPPLRDHLIRVDEQATEEFLESN